MSLGGTLDFIGGAAVAVMGGVALATGAGIPVGIGLLAIGGVAMDIGQSRSHPPPPPPAKITNTPGSTPGGSGQWQAAEREASLSLQDYNSALNDINSDTAQSMSQFAKATQEHKSALDDVLNLLGSSTNPSQVGDQLQNILSILDQADSEQLPWLTQINQIVAKYNGLSGAGQNPPGATQTPPGATQTPPGTTQTPPGTTQTPPGMCQNGNGLLNPNGTGLNNGTGQNNGTGLNNGTGQNNGAGLNNGTGQIPAAQQAAAVTPNSSGMGDLSSFMPLAMMGMMPAMMGGMAARQPQAQSQPEPQGPQLASYTPPGAGVNPNPSGVNGSGSGATGTGAGNTGNGKTQSVSDEDTQPATSVQPAGNSVPAGPNTDVKLKQDGTVIHTPNKQAATAINALVNDGANPVDAYKQAGIDLPLASTAVENPVYPPEAGDVAMLGDHYAVALGNDQVWVNGQKQPASVATGPDFMGWFRPTQQSSPQPAAPAPAPPPATATSAPAAMGAPS